MLVPRQAGGWERDWERDSMWGSSPAPELTRLSRK